MNFASLFKKTIYRKFWNVFSWVPEIPENSEHLKPKPGPGPKNPIPHEKKKVENVLPAQISFGCKFAPSGVTNQYTSPSGVGSVTWYCKSKSVGEIFSALNQPQKKLLKILKKF